MAKSSEFRLRWNSWLQKTRYPGVYRRRDGGFLIRIRVTLPNGDRPELRETLPEEPSATRAFERSLDLKRFVLRKYHEAAAAAGSHPLPSGDPQGRIPSATTPPSSHKRINTLAQARRGDPSWRSTLSSEVVAELAGAVATRLSTRSTGKTFREFAREVADTRKARGNNATPASVAKFDNILEHLSEGTTVLSADGFGLARIEGFGDLALEHVTADSIQRWTRAVGESLLSPGYYKPTTCNGWVKTLRSLMAEATHTFNLPRNEAALLKLFPTKAYRTYTTKTPNSLRPDQAYEFMGHLRDDYARLYAMTYLGLYTGLRHCNLRPLRRKGPEADINWETGSLRVARSQTRGQKSDDEVRPVTKQGTEYLVTLPRGVLQILEWHVSTQLVNRRMRASDLLFPSIRGSWRSPSLLNKAFTDISERLKLGFCLTPTGLRRTFMDLARRADIDRKVTRSISGHLTEEMQLLYESAGADETSRAISKLIDLVEGTQRTHQSEEQASDTTPIPGNEPAHSLTHPSNSLSEHREEKT